MTDSDKPMVFTDDQQRVLDSPNKTVIFDGGFACGKTHLVFYAVKKLLEECGDRTARGLIVAPDYATLMMRFRRFAKRENYSEVHKEVTLATGNKILLMDTSDIRRIISLECAVLGIDMYEEIPTPALAYLLSHVRHPTIEKIILTTHSLFLEEPAYIYSRPKFNYGH